RAFRVTGVQTCALPIYQFRFIRSSSSSLPPTVLHGIETLFDAPVVEAYGMTEASHQMTSNPLPPAARKPGTVGRSAGAEITILRSEEHTSELQSRENLV